jgi:hypothetical protein
MVPVAVAAVAIPAAITVAVTTSHAATIDTSAAYVSVNRHSGKALDLWQWSAADGATIAQYADLGGANQQWRMFKVGSGGPGPSVPYSNVPDGFAAGVTGGAGGQTVTVTTQAQLNQYVTASSPYPFTLHPAADIPAMLRTHAGPQAAIGR